MTILLGTYGKLETPFYLYTYKSNTYLSLKDINYIFFNQHLDSSILNCDLNDFVKETTTGNFLLLTRKIIRIARHFQCYSLAELCKLSLDEVLGTVAQPLLNIIDCDGWKPHTTNRVTIVERDLQFESLHGDEWPVITPPPVASTNQLVPITPPSPSPTSSSIYKWLSVSHIYSSSPKLSQELAFTAKTSKQQQAIIETRQRKNAFALSNHTKQQKMIPRKRQLNKPSKSPPTIVKRVKLTNPIPTTTTTSSGFDNLTLLATQATQLRGMLLSAENKPASPHRLPSLQTLLSDLKNHTFQ